MTQPPNPFPPANPAATHIECAEGSKRDLGESTAQPCHVCGHTVCRIGPRGPLPCETCVTVVYLRTGLRRIDELERQNEARDREIAELKGRIARATEFPI